MHISKDLNGLQHKKNLLYCMQTTKVQVYQRSLISTFVIGYLAFVYECIFYINSAFIFTSIVHMANYFQFSITKFLRVNEAEKTYKNI